MSLVLIVREAIIDYKRCMEAAINIWDYKESRPPTVEKLQGTHAQVKSRILDETDKEAEKEVTKTWLFSDLRRKSWKDWREILEKGIEGQFAKFSEFNNVRLELHREKGTHSALNGFLGKLTNEMEKCEDNESSKREAFQEKINVLKEAIAEAEKKQHLLEDKMNNLAKKYDLTITSVTGVKGGKFHHQFELLKRGTQIYHHAMDSAFKSKEVKDGRIAFTPEEFEETHNFWEKNVLTMCDQQLEKKSRLDKTLWGIYREILEANIKKLHPLFRELNDVKQQLMEEQQSANASKEREAQLHQGVEEASRKVDAMLNGLLEMLVTNSPPLPPSNGACPIM